MLSFSYGIPHSSKGAQKRFYWTCLPPPPFWDKTYTFPPPLSVLVACCKGRWQLPFHSTLADKKSFGGGSRSITRRGIKFGSGGVAVAAGKKREERHELSWEGVFCVGTFAVEKSNE